MKRRLEQPGKITPTRGPHEAPTTTQRQETILGYISSYIDQNGYPPTLREIGRRFHISSPNGVMCHLKSLRAKGLLSWEWGKSRSLKLAGRSVLLVDDSIRADVVRFAAELLQRRRSGDSG